MTSALWLLVVAILVSTAWALTHLAILIGCLSSNELERNDKLIALVPFLTPWKAWAAGKKVGVVLWGVFLVGYGAIRIAAAV